MVVALIRPSGTVDAKSRLEVTCDSEHFLVRATLDVELDGEQIAQKNWSTSIPRRLC